MKHVLDAASMRECDRYTIDTIGIPSLVLMEKAALAISHICERHALSLKRPPYQIKISAVCGPGNNGGDGAACARILNDRGFNAGVVFAGDRDHMSREMKTQLDICDNLGIPQFSSADLRGSDIIIDALFGIGLTRDVTGDFADMIASVNDSPAYTISADIPSGIDSDRGKVMGTAVKADETVAIQHIKPGHLIYPGALYSGRISIGSIGIKDIYAGQKGVYVLDTPDIKRLIPPRQKDSNKGTFGKVLVIAGNRDMSGAAGFTCLSALRCGAGMVRLVTAVENKQVIQEYVPEAIINGYANEEEGTEFIKQGLKWADVAVIGPGTGVNGITEAFLDTVISESSIPLVLDADAINCLAGKPERLTGRGNCFITPHIGEMSRLSGCSIEEIKADPLTFASEFSERFNVHCIMKDARTVIADPAGNVFINRGGNSGMATAGSGDVLTGILGAVLGRGCAPEKAGAAACFIHSYAGDLAAKKHGESFMIAGDIINSLEQTQKDLII